MHLPLIFHFLSLLPLLLNPIHASSPPRNQPSPLLTSYALDLIIASNPHPFNLSRSIHPNISNPPSSASRLRPPNPNTVSNRDTLAPRADPPPYRIPLDPTHPYGSHITIHLHEASHTLAIAQVEYCLVALNNLVSAAIRDPRIGGPEAVIPPNVRKVLIIQKEINYPNTPIFRALV